MIIDTPIIPDLARGTERTIPQDGDAQVLLPAMLQPVVDSLLPHTIAVANTVTQRRSATANFQFTRTNLASLAAVVMILPPGLYDVNCHAALRTNYTLIGSAIPDFRIHLIEAGVSRFDMLLFLSTVGANQILNTQNRLLLVSSSIIEFFINATGVGQTMDCNGSVNAVRIL